MAIALRRVVIPMIVGNGYDHRQGIAFLDRAKLHSAAVADQERFGLRRIVVPGEVCVLNDHLLPSFANFVDVAGDVLQLFAQQLQHAARVALKVQIVDG